jgi:hypothetical protein
MNRFTLTLATFLLTSIAAQAQDLDVYNADFIESGPNRAILTRDFFYTPQWQTFETHVQGWQTAKALADPDTESSLKMLQDMVRSAEERGDKETAEDIRRSIAELEEAFRVARTQANDLSPEDLKKELLGYAIGGRLFHSADILFDDLAMVRDKSWDEAEYNAWGLMDGSGKLIVPCRYEEFWSCGWDEEGRPPLIMASRVIDLDKGQWEVTILRPDGAPATERKFTGATSLFLPWRVVGVRFQDGLWGLMDEHCRILTSQKYNLIDWNENDLIDSTQGRFIYGERGGVNYILSPKDGSEIGTFKVTDTTHEVNYY